MISFPDSDAGHIVKPKDRAIAALELRQPDVVPHFELQMQLTQEYFGKEFVSGEEWESDPSKAAEYLRRDAELFIQIADRFDYAIIFYSRVCRPTPEDAAEGVRVLRELDGGQRLLMAHGDATIGIPAGSNMEEHVIALLEHGDEVKAEQDKKIDEMLVRGEKLMEAGLDGFVLCADYCLNSGPFLSPNMFAEFVTPYLTKLVKGYRDMGAYVVKHTDGQIMPILDQLVSANPHGLHSLDPMAGVDIAEVKRLYGDRICLLGNVNCALLQTGTDEEVLESCRYAMENGKPGGGYIFCTSNCIFKGMLASRYDLIFDYYVRNREYQ